MESQRLCTMLVLISSLLLAIVSAANCSCPAAVVVGPTIKLTDFPNGTWVENLNLRPDGTVLATFYQPSARIVLYDPSSNTVQTVTALSDQHTGTGPVIQIGEEGIYYYAASIHGASVTTFEPGTAGIWRVNVTSFSEGDGDPVPSTLIANVTGSIACNGGTGLAGTNLMFISDSQASVIWRIDTLTGEVDVAANDTLLRNTTAEGLGVNGIHTLRSYMYFTNTDLSVYGRFPIDESGYQIAPAEVLLNLPFTGADDFALVGETGNAILTGDPSNGTYFVTTYPEKCITKLNDLIGPTAVALEFTGNASATVWASTDGGFAGWRMQPVTVAGTLSKFSLSWGDGETGEDALALL